MIDKFFFLVKTFCPIRFLFVIVDLFMMHHSCHSCFCALIVLFNVILIYRLLGGSCAVLSLLLFYMDESSPRSETGRGRL